jgi:hypothetical protein
MTILEDLEETRLGEAAALSAAPTTPLSQQHEPDSDEAGDGAGEDDRSFVSPFLASSAAFLATAGAGWMLGGVFTGTFARLVGVTAALLGAGMVWASHKTRTPVALQFLVLPLSVVVGAILVAPDATGGTANLPSLIVEALKSGGLSSPPVPFDPGWRFLMVVLVSSVAVTAASAALAMGRPRLAVFIPAPVAVAGILVQPRGSELLSVGVALALTIGGLAIAFGADLATQGSTGSAFELRRFGRAGAMIAGLVVVLVVASQIGILFPAEQESKVIPPKRPETPPASRDRVVFRVKSPVSLPWRLGVLDVYDGTAWLTPPFDPHRFVTVPPTSRIPGARTNVPPDKQVAVEFEVTDLEGRVVPDVGSPLAWENAPKGAEIDPRTDQFRLPGRVRGGTKYTVRAAAPPDAGALIAAAAPRRAMHEFLTVPKPPPEVEQLLAQIPPGVPLYERLQFVRTKFYETVIAAGAGKPVNVPPSRVADMLAGKEASPYEITAAEALLARWAGIPARIGYGYYGGEQKDGGVLEIRPKHGAMWLEAWFEGSGWVPIVGRPPRAKSSLSQNQKNDEPTIRPTDELGAVVYVPIRLQRITLLYLLVQYWLAKSAPPLAALLLTCVFYTGLLKIARRTRRRIWAGRLGPRERVGVAYADFRDLAIDFNFGHPSMTPIEFLDVTVDDPDHTHLAWLVTRVLWGDLRRDVRSEDAEQAELYARTLRRRLAGGQSALMRTLAFASRVSLKDPYDPTIPNLWWPFSPRRKAVEAVRAVGRGVRRASPARVVRRLRPQSSAAALVVVVGVAAMLLTGCVRDVNLKTRYQRVPSLPAVPASLSGFTFEHNENGKKAFDFYYDVSLAAAGDFFGIRDAAGTVQGTLQTAVFKPGLSTRDVEVRQGVLKSVGGGRFKLERIAGERVYSLRLPEQRILLAFTSDGSAYQLLVATQGFDQAEQLFINLLAHQRGDVGVSLAQAGGAPPLDPRRGP